jgi:uncharacterized protein YukE
MKFDMGTDTLSSLAQQTGGANQDLGDLVRKLIQAAEPMEGNFHGAGAKAFTDFKGRSDQITASLNGALGSILGGQKGMDAAFQSGDDEMAGNASSAQGSANFSGASFGSRSA